MCTVGDLLELACILCHLVGKLLGTLSAEHCNGVGGERPPLRTNNCGTEAHGSKFPQRYLVYFILMEKLLSGIVRFRISTKISSFRIQWHAQVTWFLRQVSLLWTTMYVPQEEETAVGKQYILFSQFTLIEAHQVYVTASCISKPAHQPMTLKHLWINAMGLIAMLRFGLCHWIGRAMGAVLILWFVCAVTGTLVLCVSRALPGKPLCYPRSSSTWQFNNSLYLLLNCVPQEAMHSDVRFWLFYFIPFLSCLVFS